MTDNPNPGFHVSVVDGVATLTIDRPKANAIDAPTSQGMGHAFVGFEADPEASPSTDQEAGVARYQPQGQGRPTQ